jgi:hypothetical protein
MGERNIYMKFETGKIYPHWEVLGRLFLRRSQK